VPIWDRVVKTTVYLTRSQDFAEMNRIYGSYFRSGNYPARTTVVISAFPANPDFLVEVECEAFFVRRRSRMECQCQCGALPLSYAPLSEILRLFERHVPPPGWAYPDLYP
jgi:hypothetical protein